MCMNACVNLYSRPAGLVKPVVNMCEKLMIFIALQGRVREHGKTTNDIHSLKT